MQHPGGESVRDESTFFTFLFDKHKGCTNNTSSPPPPPRQWAHCQGHGHYSPEDVLPRPGAVRARRFTPTVARDCDLDMSVRTVVEVRAIGEKDGSRPASRAAVRMLDDRLATVWDGDLAGVATRRANDAGPCRVAHEGGEMGAVGAGTA
jgi:hypothetical protein